jgi:poly-gamma-glutamate capsule biosynthesis protein CapA/YwtB (metallophosphatase superfamily)
MAMARNCQRVLTAAVWLGFMAAYPGWAQSPALNVTLAGQSMIRADIRASAPSAVPAIAAMLKGDVIFTNFEGTVAKPGQPNESVPFQGSGFLAPPEALASLKALGFNLLSLSNNHSADLKAVGIQNTLEEVSQRTSRTPGLGIRWRKP